VLTYPASTGKKRKRVGTKIALSLTGLVEGVTYRTLACLEDKTDRYTGSEGLIWLRDSVQQNHVFIGRSTVGDGPGVVIASGAVESARNRDVRTDQSSWVLEQVSGAFLGFGSRD